MSISKRNNEGYYDPTAYEALTAIDREKPRKDKTKHTPPRVYICSPYRGDTEGNTQNALRYCRFAVERGYFPLAPHCYLPLFMDDNIPAERELALSFGLRLLNGCRELWVFGDVISEGMKTEIAKARDKRIPVKYFNHNFEEVLS